MLGVEEGSGYQAELFFSQNPDELRPTGGFLGMYGVLEADAARVRLERFAPIEEWLVAHPGAVVPAGQAPSALRLSFPPSAQSLANVRRTRLASGLDPGGRAVEAGARLRSTGSSPSPRGSWPGC